MAIYCIVDLHATTVPYEPAVLRERVYDTAAILLAAGLDPERCILFRQGDVPRAHRALLAALLGDLARRAEPDAPVPRQVASPSASSSPPACCFYPVLQAADVLAYRADEVPVGEDQREHLELMREIARRFNARFGGEEEILVVPEHRIPQVGARIMDLQDPTRKMSTTGGSEEGTVYVLDEPQVIEKKLKRAVTDSADPPEIRRGEDKPGVTNLIDLLAVCSGRHPRSGRGLDWPRRAATATSRRRRPRP